jgi:hypothetical protein
MKGHRPRNFTNTMLLTKTVPIKSSRYSGMRRIIRPGLFEKYRYYEGFLLPEFVGSERMQVLVMEIELCE